MKREIESRFEFKPVFVIGSPESGATLLYKMLYRTGYFNCPKIRGKQSGGEYIWIEQLGTNISEILAKDKNDLFRSYRIIAKNKILLDSSAFYPKMIDKIASVFPSAVFIYAVKDRVEAEVNRNNNRHTTVSLEDLEHCPSKTIYQILNWYGIGKYIGYHEIFKLFPRRLKINN